MKINRFSNELSNFSEADINDFNYGLGRIFRWFSYSVRCRIADIVIRRELKEEAKAVPQYQNYDNYNIIEVEGEGAAGQGEVGGGEGESSGEGAGEHA